MPKCQSRIVRRFKKSKADCCHPHCTDAGKYPACGGDVSLKVAVVDVPDYHSDHYAAIEIESACSVCKFPCVPGVTDICEHEMPEFFTKVLLEWLELTATSPEQEPQQKGVE